MGNLTRDVEMTYTPKGAAVGKLSLAINRNWTTEDGEKREEATFVDVTYFGKSAETLAQYVHKGDPLYVEGRLKLDQWDDKQSGQKRSKLHVIGEGFQFLGNKREQGESENPRDAKPKPATKRATTPATALSDENGAVLDSDDVPF